MCKYEIVNKNWCIRWVNRKDFLVDESFIRKKWNNKIAIICLFYSSFDNIKKICVYIESEKKHNDFDLILINNSWKNQNFEIELNINNLIILTPVSNIWTDWWYSLWMEYCMCEWYDYLFLIEDDVILLENNAFSDVIENINEKTVWFIYPRINDEYQHSWYVQFACYPINFLKESGVLDPRFFTRWWDWLWAPQVEKIIKSNWYKKVIINKKHFHPYLKKWNWNPWRVYFAWRNLFYYDDDIKNYIKLFMYVRTWCIKVLKNKSLKYLWWVLLWIFDYIQNKMDLNISLRRMQYFWKCRQSLFWEKEFVIKLNNIKSYTSNMFWIWFSWYDVKHLSITRNVGFIFKNGVVLPNKNCPAYPITLLSKKTVIVDEMFCDNIYNLSYHVIIIQYNIIEILLNLIVFLVSLFFSIIIYFTLLISLTIKNILYSLLSRNEKTHMN